MPLSIVRNDITRMKVDAIVNAANRSLLGGGGVDGAIHRAAGPELLAECETLGGCETGKAKLTGGYRLPSRYVIHTVGPIWQGGNSGEKELLASCYRESLKLATEKKCETVAFPLISSGAYGYPKDQALRVATDTILEYLADHDLHVYLVIYDKTSFLISRKLYANIQAFIDDSCISPDYERWERQRRLSNMPLPQAAQSRPLPKGKSSGFFQGFRRKEAEREKTKEKTEPAEREETILWDSAPCMSADEISSGLEEYLSRLDEGFREMLLRKIDEKHMTDAECYKRANVDRKLFNKIKNQKDYKPGKTTVLALAIALRLPMFEIREMLEKAGFSLSRSSKADLIVEYYIRQGNYNIFEINEALFTFDQKLLGSVMQDSQA